MAKRTLRKVVKQVQKAPKKTKIFLGIIFLIVIGGLIAGGIHYQAIAKTENSYVETIIDDLQTNFPSQTTTNLTLPTIIEGYPNIEISWSSSNSSIISSTGQVFRPLFATGNKTAELTATFTIKPHDVLAQIAFSTMGIVPVQQTFSIVVVKLEMTDEEKVFDALESLYVPKKTATNIGLTNQFVKYDSMVINWTSSDETIILADGTLTGLGEASLTATVSLGSSLEQVTFPIEVISNNDPLVYVSLDLNSIDSGTYDQLWTDGPLSYQQTIISDANSNKVLRMKANMQASVTTGLISNPASIHFSYQLYATDADKLNKASYVSVRYSSNNLDWTNLTNELITDGLQHEVEVDLSSLHNVYIQINTNSEYLTDLRIDVVDVLINRLLEANDIYEWLAKNVVKKTSESIDLLPTTFFGGTITWVSANPSIISSQGIVNQLEDATNVTLTGTISGFSFVCTYIYDIQINGYNFVEPLEMYFIDLGKYGQSDSGESIYFKVGNYDVLVDAGDDYESSNQAIQEVIDQYSEDQIIDLVIATHPDADHIGGMSFIFSQYEVLNLLQFYGTHTTQLYDNYVNSYEAEDLVSECVISDAIDNVNGCKKEFEIAPQVWIKLVETGYYETEETNGRSIVFILEAYGTKVLLTGDADNNDGRTVEANYQQEVGDIDILKAVHHATSYGTTLDFLNYSKPETIIITNGNYFGNQHGHPTADAINRMYEANDQTEVYAVVGGDVLDCEVTDSGGYECNVNDRFVDRNGTIMISIDNTGYQVHAEYFEVPLELSSTHFWETHPQKLYEYGG
ncbi:MAG: immunoglobulin-like domain-containing protein [Bacilli bacterium]